MVEKPQILVESGNPGVQTSPLGARQIVGMAVAERSGDRECPGPISTGFSAFRARFTAIPDQPTCPRVYGKVCWGQAWTVRTGALCVSLHLYPALQDVDLRTGRIRPQMRFSRLSRVVYALSCQRTS